MISRYSMDEVCVVGLGYVGIPLVSAFSEEGYSVTGFDSDEKKVNRLTEGNDDTNQLDESQLSFSNLSFTADSEELQCADYVVVCVPTPLTENNIPDTTYLEHASKSIGENLSYDTTVIYESTVYPGTTEEVCIPILEEHSGMSVGDFSVVYSPERMNPGDTVHTIKNVTKVVAANNKQALEDVASLYESVIDAEVHRAHSIKVGEAAKVIENTQRDLNIALMNELSLIFDEIGISTTEVIEAAGTKWNFQKYQPGLVGGHCIGVDPYYLTYCAQQQGYDPEVILSGRSINDRMYEQVSDMVLKGLNQCERIPQNSTVLVLGITYKANVNDDRNSKVKDLIRLLEDYDIDVVVYDPVIGEKAIQEMGFTPISNLSGLTSIEGVVHAVPHDAFSEISLNDIRELMDEPLLVDVGNQYDGEEARANGFYYNSL